MAGLKLNHIYKVYPGGVHAVNDFNLDIKDKEFIVFVGPSGCGKSTTLRMIAGIEGITAGQLFIDNELMNDTDSKDRDIAMVFQNYALYPHMTVYQNMAFGLKLRHTDPKEIDERVKKAAEILEITNLLARKPKELSGGQRQRVALGRAIVRNPKVFLLDEPLSNLDAKLRVQMRTEITKLHKELETTFIYVTHDQTEAMTMGDRIVVMKDGYMQQADTPIALFEDPANLFVATFLGSPQMNIIEGNLSIDKDAKINFTGNDYSYPLRKEVVRQLEESKFDTTRTVLFGVRPEHVHIAEKGIPAVVDVVEQLGDETIAYCKVEGIEKYIVLKTGLTGTIKRLDKVNLDFEADKVYMFDKESQHSIIGLPLLNKLPCKFLGNSVTVGEQVVELPTSFTSHLLETKNNENLFLGCRPSDVYLENVDDSHPIEVAVDFVDARTNYNVVYSKVKGIDGYLVFKAPKELELKAKAKLTVYVPTNAFKLYEDNGDTISSREEVFENTANVEVSNVENNTIIKFESGAKLVYPNMGVENGNYQLVLKEKGCKVIYNRKLTKELKLGKQEYNKNNTLQVSCYDEEVVGSKNTVFAEIKGFSSEYVTLLVDNTFSVYKMPKFLIEVPAGAIELRK